MLSQLASDLLRLALTYFQTCGSQILKLQAENDSLKIQEIEDRRRIQHLLALTQPVAQEVCFASSLRHLALHVHTAAHSVRACFVHRSHSFETVALRK